MQPIPEHDLIYDWNTQEVPPSMLGRTLEFDDETLRDGLQSPSIFDPAIEKKLEMLHLMTSLGIQGADIGLPGAGPRARADVDRLVSEIVAAKLPITPNCAARTVIKDLEPIVELSQKHGLAIEVAAFIGSSPIRQYTESWDLDFLLRTTEQAVSFCSQNNLPVMFVTEDTMRARPDHLRRLYTTAIRHGAKRVCCADTVGHATPAGARALVRYISQVAHEVDPEVKVDWHGHKDRDLAVANTLAAIEAGAARVHGTILGIGERCGNTPLDLVLVNCKLLGWIDNDLSYLYHYVEKVMEATRTVIPVNYPVFGRDAFRTATGVHAAAIIKAQKIGEADLADRIYSGVPAGWFGLQQVIEIGPMSGESNVVYWLETHGLPTHQTWIEAIFQAAKQAERILTEQEIRRIIENTPTV